MKRRTLLVAPAALVAVPAATQAAPAAPPAASIDGPSFDLRRFGADPSGARPSDAALAAALAACGESGGTVRIAQGEYRFSQTIDLARRRSIVLAGEGLTTAGAQAAARLVYTGRGNGVLINLNSAIGCQLRGLQISHSDPGFTGTYITCGNAAGSDPAFCGVFDCVLGGSAGPGTTHLDLDKCIQFTAERCNFIFGNPSVRGRSPRGYANVIRFRDCQWAANHSAPVLRGGQAWSFNGCTFEGLRSGAAGALLSGEPDGFFNGLELTGCWFGDASAGGAWIDIYGNGVHASGNYVSGNPRGPTGFVLRRSVGVQIAGNLFDQLLVGVDFAEGMSRDVVIQGNVAGGVGTGLKNAQNVVAGSLVWAPNFGLGSPGTAHVQLGANGYVAEAATGLIRQWGAAALSQGTHSVRFPLSFPGECLNVVATASPAGTASVAGFSRAGFETTVQGGGATTVYWQALGT